MKKFGSELAIAVVLIILLWIVWNPWEMFMPSAMIMLDLALLIVGFGIFANFIWREHAGDEREKLHRMFADRVAFLAGSGIVLAGIVAQYLMGELSFWLPLTLGIMVIAKVGALIYTKIKL